MSQSLNAFDNEDNSQQITMQNKHLPFRSSHFQNWANLCAKVVFPQPGFPMMMKQVGLESKNFCSLWKQI